MRDVERKLRWKVRKLRWRWRRRVAALAHLAARPVGPGSVAGSIAAVPLLALALALTLGGGAPVAGTAAETAAAETAARATAVADRTATRGAEALRRYRAVRLARGLPWAEKYGVERGLASLIRETAGAEGIDPDLAFRLIFVESRFQGGAVGPAGSVGYMQLRPSTARWLDSTVTRSELFEAETNLRLGFRYLRMLMDRYDDIRLALLAYNRGPGTVGALMDMGRDPSNGYARRVLGGPTPSPDGFVAPRSLD